METLEERERRIAHLEAERERRRGGAGDKNAGMIGDWPSGGPIEVAPGRGDLTITSGNPWMPWYPMGMMLLGNKVASFTELYLTQPWVAAAVMRMLTWSVRIPLKVYRKTGDVNSRERLLDGDHPLASAVVNPWDRGSMAQLVMNMLGPVLVHGNSVTEVLSGPRESISFGPKDWRFCRPLMPFRDSIEGFQFDVDNANLRREVSIDQVVHVAWWSPMGPIGTSPLQQLGVTVSIEDAAQRYQKSLFQNGARPPSAITADAQFLGLDREERGKIMLQLREDLQNLYSGPDNGGKPALLPPGLDWKPVGHSAVEAALIDQRRITREEIAAVYMIPPPMLGILDKATYSNIETQREMIYTDCLGPPLVLIEQALNAQVVRTLLGEKDVYCEFDFSGVLRGSKLEEIEALREQVSTALLTPNEGRDAINMPRSPNPAMDEFYIPVNNLAPVGSEPSGPPQPPRQPLAPRRRQDPNQEQQARHHLHVRSRDADYVYDPMGAR